jgi:hypothetical protein
MTPTPTATVLPHHSEAGPATGSNHQDGTRNGSKVPANAALHVIAVASSLALDEDIGRQRGAPPPLPTVGYYRPTTDVNPALLAPRHAPCGIRGGGIRGGGIAARRVDGSGPTCPVDKRRFPGTVSH